MDQEKKLEKHHRERSHRIVKRWGILGGLFFFFCFVWFLLSDCSIKKPQQLIQTSRAAIAIRGPNDFFQQGVTRFFTLRVLGKKTYSRLVYYDQDSEHDKRNEFIAELKKTLKKYKATDLFLLSHRTDRYLRWVRGHVSAKLRRKIRLVYHSGCGNSEHGEDWINLGAGSYVSHGDGLSWSPVFYYFFLRRWVRGYSLKDAVEESNRLAYQDMVSINIFTLGLFARREERLATQAMIFGGIHIHIDQKNQRSLIAERDSNDRPGKQESPGTHK